MTEGFDFSHLKINFKKEDGSSAFPLHLNGARLVLDGEEGGTFTLETAACEDAPYSAEITGEDGILFSGTLQKSEKNFDSGTAVLTYGDCFSRLKKSEAPPGLLHSPGTGVFESFCRRVCPEVKFKLKPRAFSGDYYIQKGSSCLDALFDFASVCGIDAVTLDAGGFITAGEGGKTVKTEGKNTAEISSLADTGSLKARAYFRMKSGGVYDYAAINLAARKLGASSEKYFNVNFLPLFQRQRYIISQLKKNYKSCVKVFARFNEIIPLRPGDILILKCGEKYTVQRCEIDFKTLQTVTQAAKEPLESDFKIIRGEFNKTAVL